MESVHVQIRIRPDDFLELRMDLVHSPVLSKWIDLQTTRRTRWSYGSLFLVRIIRGMGNFGLRLAPEVCQCLSYVLTKPQHEVRVFADLTDLESCGIQYDKSSNPTTSKMGRTQAARKSSSDSSFYKARTQILMSFCMICSTCTNRVKFPVPP